MPINRGSCRCNYCPDSFGSWGAVYSHARAKHGIFRCSECGLGFRSEPAMNHHYNTNHHFECPECNLAFWTREEMIQHYNSRHCFGCPECGREFTTPDAMDEHYNTIHLTFECPECYREFRTEEAMGQHYDAIHRFECPNCGGEFTTQAAMRQHHDAEHRMVECPECYREFKTEQGMDQHYDTKHRVKCLVCDTKFNTQAAMDQHYNANHRFECTSCLRYFTTESVLNQHLEANHRFRCVHCPDIFTTEGGRSQHYEAKHNFPCPKCSKKFVTTAERRIHHENEHKVHPCPKCLEEFKTEAAMDQHVGKVHKPPPSILPRDQPFPTAGGEPNRANVDDTKSPPRPPMPTGVTYPDQNQGIIRPNRFYCQEADCGRGFSTQGFLDSHGKFFHPKKPSKPSSSTPEVATGSGALDAEEHGGEVRLPVKQPSNKGHAPSKPDKRDTTTDIAAQFRCRICNTPPSVGTQPAATFCGHLFCYKCILSKVASTSKCPICDTTILTGSVFKLDISR